jgi:hypothetical protein
VSAAAHRRVKAALDETRLLILGAEVLFGFHLNSVFQPGFPNLAPHARVLHALSFLMMAIVVALLIAPSLQHRLVDDGQSTVRIVQASAWFAALALFPFALALGADLYIVTGYRFGLSTGAIVGIVFTATALFAWYGAEWLGRRPNRREEIMHDEPHTPIDVRVEHMLTEARVLLPGAQALLGFQFAAMFTDAFGGLSEPSKLIHAAGLCCISLTVILLMAPASFHRIAFNGQNTEEFHRLGSTLVVAGAIPLAGGIVCDLYVAVVEALGSPAIGAAIALAGLAALIALWLVHPLLLRAKHGR